MTHTWYKCKCNEVGCQFCDGGLGMCTVCGGFEGSLPTDCPGVEMSTMTMESIYQGTWDYREGKGWCKPDGTGNSMGDFKIQSGEEK